jgi:RNA polymerase sigma-70 factor (ECF subfamily)
MDSDQPAPPPAFTGVDLPEAATFVARKPGLNCGGVARSSRGACPIALVAAAQRGNSQKFERLWERYAPTVQGILLTMVTDAEADDLAQEVAIAAFRALPTLEKLDCFPAWLCTIARNLGRDALRDHSRNNDAPLSEAAGVAAPPQGDPTASDEILARIRDLPECYREPLLLRLLLEMTGPEIAEQTGMTEGSVRVNLCRGMKLLRRSLEHWGLSDG